MANIVIIGSEAQHASSTRLRDILQAPPSNHACTLIAESSTQSLLSFDLIITTRVNGGVSANSNILNAFNNGVPLICGLTTGDHNGFGLNATALHGKIGLTSVSINGGNSNKDILITSNQLGAGYSYGDVVNTHITNDFYSPTKFTALASGAIQYASDTIDSNNNCILAIATKGSSSLTNTPFPASCAYVGFLYSNTSNYSLAAKKLINLIVNKVLDANLTAVISGYSLNENSEPVPSDVYVYKHEDGTLFKKTTTNPDGSYAVTVGTGEYFVVCNNNDRDSNLQVLGYIKGVE